jgi:hypothetical protein
MATDATSREIQKNRTDVRKVVSAEWRSCGEGPLCHRIKRVLSALTSSTLALAARVGTWRRRANLFSQRGRVVDNERGDS